MKSKAIALFSGGLDSLLAVKLVQEQGIEVIPVAFITPFFGPEKPGQAATQISVQLTFLDITEPHLRMLQSPKYGYGRNMNPCIDCHALMLRVAGEKMRELGADFLITGEVLGQRPMSQTRQSLHVVARHSGFEGHIVRPLSARLLPETIPEQEGKIDRDRLLDIQGRGRKRQMEMAERYGISYSNPAGGCLLTDPIFSRRLRDLLIDTGNEGSDESGGGLEARDIELLKTGRHLRISEMTKIIVGKNEKDNAAIRNLRRPGDTALHVLQFPGPLVLIPGGADESEVREAAAICARYSDAPPDAPVSVECETGDRIYSVEVVPADPEKVAEKMI